VTLEARPVPPGAAEAAVRFRHEAVHCFADEAVGYFGVIAIHSTALGPAVGGTRAWRYDSPDAAAIDALRLARGMTSKNALAGLPLGGGKSVIALPPGRFDREAVYRAHGRAVETLAGRYVTATDVGTRLEDLRTMRRETRWVLGLESESARSGWWTARGVYHAIRGALRQRHGSAALAGRTVAVQGSGSVGAALCGFLAEAGATVVVSDIDAARARTVAVGCGGRVEPAAGIHRAAADVFAPCALGGVLHAGSIAELGAAIVAGGANNQLAEDEDADRLAARGVGWVPDYLANAGGVITAGTELFGWDTMEVRRRVEAIEETTARLLGLAAAEGITPLAAADRVVMSRLGR
jgi:leucine dehydrogenase